MTDKPPPFSAQLVAKDREHADRLRGIVDGLRDLADDLDREGASGSSALVHAMADELHNEIARWRRAMGLP